MPLLDKTHIGVSKSLAFSIALKKNIGACKPAIDSRKYPLRALDRTAQPENGMMDIPMARIDRPGATVFGRIAVTRIKGRLFDRGA